MRVCKPHANVPRLEGTTWSLPHLSNTPAVPMSSCDQAECRASETSPPVDNCLHIEPQFTASKQNRSKRENVRPLTSVLRRLYLGPEARVPCPLRDTAVGAVPASAHAVIYRPDTDLTRREIDVCSMAGGRQSRSKKAWRAVWSDCDATDAPTISRAAVIPYDMDCTRQETPMLSWT